MKYALEFLMKHKKGLQIVINYLEANKEKQDQKQIQINKERITSIDVLLKFIKDREFTFNFDLNCGAKVNGYIKEWKPCVDGGCEHCITFKNKGD